MGSKQQHPFSFHFLGFGSKNYMCYINKKSPLLINVNDMKLSYVRGLEQDGAEFWLKRVPYLPMRSEIIDIVDFYWTLHQIPDEQKLESLKEIYRILKPQGTLHSTSFGYWEGHTMPSSIYPIVKKQTFLNLHVSAGFKPRSKIEERSDSTRSFEKFWYGTFQKTDARFQNSDDRFLLG